MHVLLHVACKPLSANKQILNIYCRHSQTAFPRRFKTALRRHVVPTPWIPAPTRLSNAEPGNPSGTNPAIPEEGNTRPAPPYNDSGTNRVPANSKLPTRAGPGLAGPGRPVPSRQGPTTPWSPGESSTIEPNRPAPRAHPYPLPLTEGRAPAPPCCRAPHSTGRDRKKEGPHRQAAAPSREGQRRQAQLGPRGTPAHLAAGPPPPPAPAPPAPRPQDPAPLPPPHKGASSWQAAAYGGRRGSNQLRERRGMRGNFQALRKDREACTGTPHSLAPSGGAIWKELAREARRGWGASRNLTPTPARGAPAKQLWERRRPTCSAPPRGGPRPQRPTAWAWRGRALRDGSCSLLGENAWAAAASGKWAPPRARGRAGERLRAHAVLWVAGSGGSAARAAAGARWPRQRLAVSPHGRPRCASHPRQRAAPRRAGPDGTPVWGFAFSFGLASRGARMHASHRRASSQAAKRVSPTPSLTELHGFDRRLDRLVAVITSATWGWSV